MHDFTQLLLTEVLIFGGYFVVDKHLPNLTFATLQHNSFFVVLWVYFQSSLSNKLSFVVLWFVRKHFDSRLMDIRSFLNLQQVSKQHLACFGLGDLCLVGFVGALYYDLSEGSLGLQMVDVSWVLPLVPIIEEMLRICDSPEPKLEVLKCFLFCILADK